MKTFRYVVRMPSVFVFDDPNGISVGVNHNKNPNGFWEKTLRERLYYNTCRSSTPETRFKRPETKVGILCNQYGYKITHHYETFENVDYVGVIVNIKTDAKGSHLDTILNHVANVIKSGSNGCSMWLKAANISYVGYDKIDPDLLADCEHKDAEFINVLNDTDGSIVSIHKCKKCNSIFKKAVR